MRAVKIDFQTKLSSVVADGEVTLESLVAGKKAVLLHFWSPWSRECEAAMPDFLATAATLAANSIGVASLIPGDAEKILADARLMIGKNTGQANGAWLIDSSKSPIARDLRVQNLPTMVLISAEGKVLFNGDPTDDAFWDALTKINPSIQRPGSPRDGDDE
jgi:thioredoxin-like negative regulator of GroEL